MFQNPVGSFVSETAMVTLLRLKSNDDLTTMMEANHRWLGASYRTFGSEMKKDPVTKNEERSRYLAAVPVFETTNPSRLTISTT